jgi:hypothetical protein
MRGSKIPDFLKNCPVLQEGLDLFWDAFGTLSTCRALGQGVLGPIPWTAIMDFCDRMEIVDEQRDRMVAYLRTMDKVYIEHFSQKLREKWQTSSSPQSTTSKG